MRACAFCGGPIPKGKRWDARYCSDLCRGRKHRGAVPETATNGNAGKRDGSRQPAKPRRDSRNGLGVHIYLTATDLADPTRLDRKLETARQRLETR